MPQLAPAPWLAILIFTWLIFLTVLPPKILAYNLPNETASQTVIKPKTHPWPWPWH